MSLREGAREYVAGDYESVLRRWTRTAELATMAEVDNVLGVTATYESWDFRWAYAVRYADDYQLTVDQRHLLLKRALAETRQGHQFFVALYTQKPRWNDLTAERPAWVVRLVDDHGNETAPLAIEEIRHPGALEAAYFPYTTPWRAAYRIRFPNLQQNGYPTVARNAKSITLRFTGAQGHEQLSWDLTH